LERKSQVERDELGRVFFVDDEPRICRIVCRTLEREGAIVKTFNRAQDCLMELNASPCDLLITDVKMSGMDGMELLTEVRRKHPRLPVVVLTAFGDVSMAVKALKQGAVDFIEKPFDRDVFLETVRTMLLQIRQQDSQLSESLTKTEMTVLRLLVEGKKNREIAAVLHRSSRTVEVHRSHLMHKMAACNVAELLRRTADLGLFANEQPLSSENTLEQSKGSEESA
jgi:two-component system, LuxR family, response regulator FixJ